MGIRLGKIVILGLVCFGTAGQVSSGMPKKKAERFVAAARELLGVTYRFGGRLQGDEPGIDCQGLVFYAAERIGPCRWKSFSTLPTSVAIKPVWFFCAII